MKSYKMVFAAGLAAAALLWPGSAEMGGAAGMMSGEEQTEAAPEPTPDAMDTIISRWPEAPRALAMYMIATYGEPDRFNPDALIWSRIGPWRRTIVHRSAPIGSCRTADDLLQQTVDYRVPLEKFADLASFDRRLQPNRTRDELSSCAKSMQLNILALNLADEIIQGKRDPEAARIFQRQTMDQLAAGKSSPYTQRLRFVSSGGMPAPK